MPKLSAAPKLSEDVEEIFAACDFTEWGYRHIEHLRRQKDATAETREKIDAHDEIERRIAESPNDVMHEAHRALDHGTELLLKLIRSKKLRNALHPTELGRKSGIKTHHSDHGFQCLSSRIEYINRQLIRLAEIGVPGARHSIFFQAEVLSEAFIRLAQAYPEDFRDVAESSLTMPSIRARDPAFSADAEKIAERIHLAEKHPAKNISDNRERLGGLCHRLVANLVNTVQNEREDYLRNQETYNMLRKFKETAAEYRSIRFHEWLKSRYYPTKLPGLLASAKLLDLEKDPDSWWRSRILPMVKEEFARLHRQPVRNAALWEELRTKTPKYTAAAMRRLMEKNCRNKLFRIAEACP